MSRLPVRSICLISLALLLQFQSLPCAAAEDEEGTKGKVIRFDHARMTPTGPFRMKLRDGEVFTVQINKTWPDNYTYEIAGFTVEEVSDEPEAAGDRNISELVDDVRLLQVHDRNYGGYYVNIRLKQGMEPVKFVDGNETNNLEEATLTIFVETMSWEIDIAGAFTVSDLTNPVYAVQSGDDGMGGTINTVIRDTAAEDEASLGLAAMIHLYNSRRPQYALSFGLGISENSNTTYYVGPSYRFGKRAAVTLGYAWGSVDRLPSGLSEGNPISDANALNNLGTRIDSGVFLSLSYGFLDVRNRIQQPFANEVAPKTQTTTEQRGGGSGGEGGEAGAGTLTDTDGDGVADAVDNCPSVANERQEDSDGDNVGDACEADG